jgi:hypothetical protein
MAPPQGERSVVVFRATRPSTGGMSYTKRVSAAGEPPWRGVREHRRRTLQDWDEGDRDDCRYGFSDCLRTRLRND